MSNLIEEDEEEGNPGQSEQEQMNEENRDMVSALEMFSPTP
jgi:hypothetical protein